MWCKPVVWILRISTVVVKMRHLESTNKPSKIKQISIMHGTIFVKHTLLFLGHKNDFLQLITVSMLKIAEDTNCNLLKGISKIVESMADKLPSHVITNTSSQMISKLYWLVVIAYNECYMSQCDWYLFHRLDTIVRGIQMIYSVIPLWYKNITHVRLHYIYIYIY
jgi:hypothetical protein